MKRGRESLVLTGKANIGKLPSCHDVYGWAGRHGKKARRSARAWSARCVLVVGRENLRPPKSLFKTPDPFNLSATGD